MTPGLALVGLWALLAVYSVLMALDLGAGAFLSWARLRGDEGLERVVETYATPVWEAVNSLLVLLLLGMEAFFPRVINLYASVLLVPLGLTFGLIAARQVAFAMRHEAVPGLGGRGRPAVAVVAGVLGLLAPLPAMSFFTVLQGHGFRLVHELPVSGPVRLIVQPITLTFMLLALAAELHLAAVFLRWLAERMGEEGARRTLSVAAVRLAPPVGVAALLALATLARTVPEAAPALGRVWPLWLAAVAGLGAAARWIQRDRPGVWPLVFTAVMYLGGYMALGLAQLPYLVRGQVTAAQAFTSGAMAGALGGVFALGFVLVVLPSAALLTAYLVAAARRHGPV